MLVIKFSIHNSRLRRITSGIIPSNAYGKLKFEFDFRTNDWAAVETKVANFYYKGANYRIKLDANNQCYVPKEVIYAPSFSVSIYGGDMITNSIRNPVEEVKSDSPTTPDIFDDDTTSNNINILDGGTIIFDLTDDPTEDDESNLPSQQSVVDYIIKNEIPCFSGLIGSNPSKIAYQQLNESTAKYTDQCFYTTTNADGKIINAGYQITFEENAENMAQTFLIYSAAKIVTAYQYQPAFNQWLDMGFDGTYWVENGTDTKIINSQEVSYTIYAYNVELMGDAITSPEYWRFEVEV